MKLWMAKQELELGGKYLGTLRESNDILDDPVELRERMSQDGYLLLRGLQNPDTVRAARQLILNNLDANNQIDRNYPLDDGVIKAGAHGAFLGGSKALTRDPAFLHLVESPEIMGFFARMLRSDVITFDYKWLRLVSTGDYTGAHYDIVYMNRGTHNLYTCSTRWAMFRTRWDHWRSSPVLIGSSASKPPTVRWTLIATM